MTQIDPIERKPVQRVEPSRAAAWKNLVFGLCYRLGLNALARVVTRNKPRILMFHHITEEGGPGLTPSKMNKMLAYIADRYNVMSVSQLAQHMTDHGQCPQNTIVLTFDDGYTSFADYAMPLLEAHNLPATLFVCPTLIAEEGNEPTLFDGQELVDWPTLAQLASSPLVEIGAHSMTHPVLSATSDTDSQSEIESSKETLEARLGRPITSFCYPYGMGGDFTDAHRDMVRDAGYSCATASWFGFVELGDDDIYALPRIGCDNFQTFGHFRKNVDGLEFLQRRLLTD